MPRYVATLRAVYNALDDTEAVFIADQIRLNGATDLDEEDNDLLDVTQVTSTAIDIRPEEVIQQLKHARNLLIRTRLRSCYELARSLDQEIHQLEHRSDASLGLVNYDYAKFMDIADQILIQGVTPDE